MSSNAHGPAIAIHATPAPPVIRGLAYSAVILMALLSVNGALAQEPEMPWWSIDGGGEMITSAGDRTLSGTLGQWDDSPGQSLEGGAWTLTGGFWAVNLETDVIFRDGYEGLIAASPDGAIATGGNP